MPSRERCYGELEWVFGEITDRCPMIWAREYAIVFTAAAWMDRGVLPHSGGWADQPAVLMQLAQVALDEQRKAAAGNRG